MTYTLPTDAEEWVAAWRERINDREQFAAAAEGFDAAFRFEIRDDGRDDGDLLAFHVDIEDGTCTAASLAEADGGYDFVLRGPFDAWSAMLSGTLDVSEAVMDGTFDIEGNTMTLLRRQDAVAEMVAAAQNVDTEFAR
ncbi:SCP2 sterol-binding domain-containing protein [Halomicroarcula sp. GCM10025324]|uniref:SCP2 sterol-binding domain-containing protein n=1 Tax=Haloarcula TaxID=2237 RepID=UPI0023E7B0B8|nr:SCP2 sterol-binding domain-containing protein [Halomicroarcula sp. ZS-22-S1]